MKSTVDTVFENHFHLVDENLSTLGFSTNQKQAIYMVLSAILNVGNIHFDALINDDRIQINVDSHGFLRNAAVLLKINESDLEDVLICHIREVGKTQIK